MDHLIVCERGRFTLGSKEGDLCIHVRCGGGPYARKSGIFLIGGGKVAERGIGDLLIKRIFVFAQLPAERCRFSPTVFECSRAILLGLSLRHDLGRDPGHARLHLLQKPDAQVVFFRDVVSLLGRKVFKLVGEPGERFLGSFDILVDALAHIDFVGLARHGFHFRCDGCHRLESVAARCPRRTDRLLRLLDFSDDHLDGRRDSRDQDADTGGDESAFDGQCRPACRHADPSECRACCRAHARKVHRGEGHADLSKRAGRRRADVAHGTHHLRIEPGAVEGHRRYHADDLRNHSRKGLPKANRRRCNLAQRFAQAGEVSRVEGVSDFLQCWGNGGCEPGGKLLAFEVRRTEGIGNRIKPGGICAHRFSQPADLLTGYIHRTTILEERHHFATLATKDTHGRSRPFRNVRNTCNRRRHTRELLCRVERLQLTHRNPKRGERLVGWLTVFVNSTKRLLEAVDRWPHSICPNSRVLKCLAQHHEVRHRNPSLGAHIREVPTQVERVFYR